MLEAVAGVLVVMQQKTRALLSALEPPQLAR
jgi:hypothetical protein